jgi:hypothetical protein
MGVLKGHSEPCCAHRESNPDYNLTGRRLPWKSCILPLNYVRFTDAGS